MNKKFLAMAALALITTGAQAKVKLPHILGDNMILQQNTEANLWGWDKPGTTVEVTTSWSGQKYSAKTGKDGKWAVKVQTPKASYAPLSITFDDGEKTTLNNVLAGEVWVCAGQSNMEMPVKGFGNCPVEGYNKAVLEANQYKGVHYVKIPSVMSSKPLDDANCEWKEVNPETVGDASATGYFFAQVINKTLDIPVGLVMANKGGSRVESWLDRDYLKKNTKEDLDSVKLTKSPKFKWDFLYPLLWGNGTFHPILNYSVKGILFYQGCSNVGDPDGQYTKRLADLVAQWRRDFKQGELPFYFVQIAPYHNGDVNGDWGPKLREQQFNAAKVIPNSGIVCTEDLVYPYEVEQIHPCQKQPAGERLALQALSKTYGMKGLFSESMTFKEMKIVGDTVKVHFDNTYGAYNRFEGIEGFEVAGEDKVFHKATAKHFWQEGNDPWNECVIVTSPEVKKPVALRYCFRNFQLGNMANAGNLPLFPFRTDNW